jgi:sulfofructose kinase
MTSRPPIFDLLCIGHASYDLIFSVPHHPGEDEKIVADDLLGCGGGPAANAAVTAARLGFHCAFAGYLGNDVFGNKHLAELNAEGVNAKLLVRGNSPTPLSTILVKPNGQRALVNYKGDTSPLLAQAIDFSDVHCKAALLDGHEALVSLDFLQQTNPDRVISVLDAGSLHDGTVALMDKVGYLVASEKFALQYAGNVESALQQLAERAPVVVITLGEHGLVWQRGQENGRMSAPPVIAIDTTGAGDAFHGALAAALTTDMSWSDSLRYASVAGALCCSKMGARSGLPTLPEQLALFAAWQP